MTTETPTETQEKTVADNAAMDVDQAEEGGENGADLRHKQLERKVDDEGAKGAASGGKSAPSTTGPTGKAYRRNGPPIDREKVCPFLLRLYVNTKEAYNADDIQRGGVPEKDEHRIHTWKNATLRELASLLTTEFPEAAERNAVITFHNVVRPVNKDTRYRVHQLGAVLNFKPTYDDQKTLEQSAFKIGDGVLVSIILTDPAQYFARPPQFGGASNGHGPQHGGMAGPGAVHPERRDSARFFGIGSGRGRDEGGFRSGDRGTRRHEPYANAFANRRGGRGGGMGGERWGADRRGDDRRAHW
ncbi:Sin3 associated polypeptide p18-domain-containing protein [Fimicolochytrium jonesii]|uniref:Sin3 associated polypeptide p18-domain-containing protein n=1 Tax=Fimicolochytrium jonesii TaxID=1396493 RepID=UPI0022FEA9ED|nr:Sin3 associated polypeptide p18-domain-containing protein [Fimicolochytrium jonesii]KAI8816297.1 Sin3 associated polypeptide p18-domain-containing protein [Fimicolochytrium jonesii]